MHEHIYVSSFPWSRCRYREEIFSIEYGRNSFQLVVVWTEWESLQEDFSAKGQAFYRTEQKIIVWRVSGHICCNIRSYYTSMATLINDALKPWEIHVTWSWGRRYDGRVWIQTRLGVEWYYGFVFLWGVIPQSISSLIWKMFGTFFLELLGTLIARLLYD